MTASIFGFQSRSAKRLESTAYVLSSFAAIYAIPGCEWALGFLGFLGLLGVANIAELLSRRNRV